MPQLEQIATYGSQIFWLLVTFSVLLIAMWKMALPRVADVLNERQERIDNDLERAEKVKEEAEEVLQAYEATVAKARTEAQSILHAAADKISAESEKRHTELAQKLAGDAAEAEQRIDKAREDALANIRSVSAEVAQAAAARLVGANVSEGDAEAAVSAAIEERR